MPQRHLWVVCLFLVCARLAYAARTVAMDQPFTVRIEVGQPSAVAFHETIVNVVYPELVSAPLPGQSAKEAPIRSDGPYVFILTDNPAFGGRVFAVGQSGKLYPFVVKVSGPADDIVYVTAAVSHAQAPTLSPSSLVRALLTKTPLPASQSVEFPTPTVPDTTVTIRQAQAIRVGAFIGQTLTLHNPQATHIVLDSRLGEPAGDGVVALTRWTWPPQYTVRLIHVDGETIPPDGLTRVYVVYEKRS